MLKAPLDMRRLLAGLKSRVQNPRHMLCVGVNQLHPLPEQQRTLRQRVPGSVEARAVAFGRPSPHRQQRGHQALQPPPDAQQPLKNLQAQRGCGLGLCLGYTPALRHFNNPSLNRKATEPVQGYQKISQGALTCHRCWQLVLCTAAGVEARCSALGASLALRGPLAARRWLQMGWQLC